MKLHYNSIIISWCVEYKYFRFVIEIIFIAYLLDLNKTQLLLQKPSFNITLLLLLHYSINSEDVEDEEDEDEDREEGGGGEWGRQYMYGELVQQPPRRVSFSLVRSLSSRPPTSLACYPSTTPRTSSRAISTPGTPARAHSPGLTTPMASLSGRRHSMPAYMTLRDTLTSPIAKTSRYFAAGDTNRFGDSKSSNKLSLPNKYNKISPASVIDRKNSVSSTQSTASSAGGSAERSRKTSAVSVATTDEYVDARSSPDSEGESADSSCTDTSEDEEAGKKSMTFSMTSSQQQPENCAQHSSSRLSHVTFARNSALPVVSV